jgi:uncharacterized protein (TIGR00369 family)
MPSSDHYHKLERMYLSAPINQFYSPTIEIAEGRSVIQFPVRPEFFHPGNAIHGSVYFKALDDAAFFAVNSLVEDCFVVTVSFNIYLTRPVSEGILLAEGRVVSGTANHFVGDSVLTVGGHEVARGSGTFLRSKIKLSDTPGYA